VERRVVTIALLDAFSGARQTAAIGEAPGQSGRM
jgi:hypothetical protein